MAEIALGGIQIAVRSTRSTSETCPHNETLSAISSGVERVVCESCGHMSIRFHDTVSGPVVRERFSRPADDLAAVTSPDPYTTHVRSSPKQRYSFAAPDLSVGVVHRPQVNGSGQLP